MASGSTTSNPFYVNVNALKRDKESKIESDDEDNSECFWKDYNYLEKKLSNKQKKKLLKLVMDEIKHQSSIIKLSNMEMTYKFLIENPLLCRKFFRQPDIADRFTFSSEARYFLAYAILFLRIFMTVVILILTTVLFSIFYAKCWKNITDGVANFTVNDKFFSNFTKKTLTDDNINEMISLSIPFCSCLYKDGFYSKKLTPIGYTINIILIVFLALELHQIVIKKIVACCKCFRNRTWLYTLSVILVNLFTFGVGLLICLISVYLLSYFISLGFELVNFLTDQKAKSGFNFFSSIGNYVSWFYKIHVTRTHDHNSLSLSESHSFYIQIMLFYCMYTLKNQLKLFGTLGVLVIRYNMYIKRFLKFSAIASLLLKFLAPMFHNLDDSLLPVNVYLHSTINQTQIINLTNITNIAQLRKDVKRLFIIQLTDYIYENSLLNKIVPLIAFVFILYLLFVLVKYFIHLILPYTDDYIDEDELEFEKLRQHLLWFQCYLKWPESKWGIKKPKFKRPIRYYLDAAWSFIFKGDEIDKLIENLKKIDEFKETASAIRDFDDDSTDDEYNESKN